MNSLLTNIVGFTTTVITIINSSGETVQIKKEEKKDYSIVSGVIDEGVDEVYDWINPEQKKCHKDENLIEGSEEKNILNILKTNKQEMVDIFDLKEEDTDMKE
ncbi:MAG: hypothetical protein CfP315_0159 [Candidatus Improbicoccus pseudotrichonymphae]|uniref:Uncharacterized protein n=1 Tax=Candidatus Improbicoccus pseudotrichonymphae TaxID=3033792 RepID=A0AA48HUL0_9FIRM|nr:MAG: hypothetical protein CfP315_0159 [Candidatus Improbicoccus pseudotrichonymphae]